MRVLAIILFVTMGCSLVYPAPNMGFAERRIDVRSSDSADQAPRTSLLGAARPRLDALLASSSKISDHLPQRLKDSKLLGGVKNLFGGLLPSNTSS